MEKIICGIQQVGIGVKSVAESWEWYIKHLGFDTKIFGDEGVAEKMLPYTAGKPQPRYAILALNLRGGGGFEVWEPRGRELNYPKEEAKLGDLGIYICKIKTPNIDAAYSQMDAEGVNILYKPVKSPSGIRHFAIKDLWGNIFQVEEDNYVFINEKKNTGGVNGVIIGVSDMDRSIKFYTSLLDYDKVVFDSTDVFSDLKGLPNGDKKLRRVILERTKPIQGPLCELMGTSHIELIQTIEGEKPHKIYEERLWGDPGFIHLCFDIRCMAAIEECAKSLGHSFVCDGGVDFDMGDANGHFTYVEDPDGTLIEFVETFKVPILKKWGIFLNLKDRDPKKPLPRFMTKALRFLK
jgi:catechol 2,3-dioxygenase-like lactoylglutathione lyase family enzyme